MSNKWLAMVPPRPREVSSARVHSLALRSIEALRLRGWTQRTICSEDGKVCAQGAMLYALGVNPSEVMTHGMPTLYNTALGHDFDALDAAFSRAVSDSLPLWGGTGVSTVGFNDSVAKRMEDVITIFQRIVDATAPSVPAGAQTDHELAGGPNGGS